MRTLFSPLVFAFAVVAGSALAVEPPLPPVQADLRALELQIMDKVKAGQRTALALAGEMATFDALLAKYAGQPEAQASVLMDRAAVTRGILKDEPAAKALYEAVLKDFPGTRLVESAKRALHSLSPEGKAEIAARQAEIKAKHDALMSGLAPDFTVQSFADGREVKLSDYRGKIIVLDFWASWCGPCKVSMPHNQEVAAAYKDQDVVVFAVCVWDDRAKAEAWLKENQPNYPDLHWAFDPAGRSDDNPARKLYGVGGIPAQFIIGRDGRMVDMIVGYRPGERILEAALSRAGVKVDTALVAKGEADLERRGS